MAVDLYIISSFFKSLVGKNMNVRFVITIQKSWLRKINMKFVTKISEPLYFESSSS